MQNLKQTSQNPWKRKQRGFGAGGRFPRGGDTLIQGRLAADRLPWSSGALEARSCPRALRICVLGLRSSQGLPGFLSACQAACQVAWKFGRRGAKLLAPFQMGCRTAGNLDARASRQPTAFLAGEAGRGKKAEIRDANLSAFCQTLIEMETDLPGILVSTCCPHVMTSLLW